MFNWIRNLPIWTFLLTAVGVILGWEKLRADRAEARADRAESKAQQANDTVEIKDIEGDIRTIEAMHKARAEQIDREEAGDVEDGISSFVG